VDRLQQRTKFFWGSCSFKKLITGLGHAKSVLPFLPGEKVKLNLVEKLAANLKFQSRDAFNLNGGKVRAEASKKRLGYVQQQ
jgi:hypothetical protein